MSYIKEFNYQNTLSLHNNINNKIIIINIIVIIIITIIVIIIMTIIIIIIITCRVEVIEIGTETARGANVRIDLNSYGMIIGKYTLNLDVTQKTGHTSLTSGG